MLKKRLVITLTINDGQFCRTKHFNPDRNYTLNFVDLEGADELVVIDVTPGGRSEKFIKTVEKLSEQLFLPMAVGGWCDDWAYARDLMNAGADKIILNHNPNLKTITEFSERLGASSTVARITKRPDLEYRDVCMDALVAQTRGAGEIFFQNRARDGSLTGYDCVGVRMLHTATTIPIVAMSGCGTWKHMVEAFVVGANACATSNVLHITPSHIRLFKENIMKAGVLLRPWQNEGCFGSED